MAHSGCGEVSVLISGIASEKKEKSRSNAPRSGIFSKSKSRGFFLTLTSSKAEKTLQSMYVNGGAMSRS